MYHQMSVEAVQELGADVVRFRIENQSALLTVNDIEALMDTLIQIRARMQPEHPREPLPSHNYPLEVDPSWHVDKNPLFDGAVVVLRHGGVGWIAYAFPKPSLAKLNDVLSAQVPHSFDMSSIPS